MSAALHSKPDRPHPDRWIKVLPEGLYVEPGGFYINPVRPVERAVVTHGHSDHARPGNRHVLATPGTLAIMRQRMGEGVGGSLQALDYGEGLTIGEVRVRLVPAGHVLGSAQVVLEHAGSRVVVSGDYKRRLDRTCAPFEPVPCDVFVTEATFGLPVFRHPPDLGEVAKLLHSMALFPERSHVVGVYAGFIDTDMAAGIDAPKTSPQQVAERSLDGIRNGLDHVLADARAEEIWHASRTDPAGLAAQQQQRWDALAKARTS